MWGQIDMKIVLQLINNEIIKHGILVAAKATTGDIKRKKLQNYMTVKALKIAKL